MVWVKKRIDIRYLHKVSIEDIVAGWDLGWDWDNINRDRAASERGVMVQSFSFYSLCHRRKGRGLRISIILYLTITLCSLTMMKLIHVPYTI